MKQLFGILLLSGLFALPVQAQKYGHLNVGNLLELMPETKAADEELKNYQEELRSKGQEMANAFREEAEKFLADAQAGNLAPVVEQKKREELTKKQEEIANYEKEMERKLNEKRRELLGPIEKKVIESVEKIAKENGYTMVFNTSMFNSILFVRESDDLLPLMKAELGVE
jgi:outer membrane protein